MRVDMSQYAIYLAIKATFDQNPAVPRVPVADYVDWLAIEKIDGPDFNSCIRQVEAQIERAKKLASVIDREDRRVDVQPMKQRDRTKLDREHAAAMEAAAKRGPAAVAAVAEQRREEAPLPTSFMDADDLTHFDNPADDELALGQQQNPPGTVLGGDQDPAA